MQKLAATVHWQSARLRVNDSPVPLHVDDHPSALRGFIQTAHELPDVGIAVVRPLAFGVGVMNDDAEARPLRAGCPLEHFEVAVRIAEGYRRPPADGLVDADRLPRFVVVEVNLRQS